MSIQRLLSSRHFSEGFAGDDYQLTYDANGYPEPPVCLRRAPQLKLVVSNPSLSSPQPKTEVAWEQKVQSRNATWPSQVGCEAGTNRDAELLTKF
jgi:hypothetical protein